MIHFIYPYFKDDALLHFILIYQFYQYKYSKPYFDDLAKIFWNTKLNIYPNIDYRVKTIASLQKYNIFLILYYPLDDQDLYQLFFVKQSNIIESLLVFSSTYIPWVIYNFLDVTHNYVIIIALIFLEFSFSN